MDCLPVFGSDFEFPLPVPVPEFNELAMPHMAEPASDVAVDVVPPVASDAFTLSLEDLGFQHLPELLSPHILPPETLSDVKEQTTEQTDEQTNEQTNQQTNDIVQRCLECDVFSHNLDIDVSERTTFDCGFLLDARPTSCLLLNVFKALGMPNVKMSISERENVDRFIAEQLLKLVTDTQMKADKKMNADTIKTFDNLVLDAIKTISNPIAADERLFWNHKDKKALSDLELYYNRINKTRRSFKSAVINYVLSFWKQVGNEASKMPSFIIKLDAALIEKLSNHKSKAESVAIAGSKRKTSDSKAPKKAKTL